MIGAGCDLMSIEAKAKRSWRGASTVERRRHVNREMVVMYPELSGLLDDVVRRGQRAQASGIGDAILAILNSGQGKTHFCSLLKRVMPDEEAPDRSIRRIASFSVPLRPTPDLLSHEFLRALGDPAWHIRPQRESTLARAVRLAQGVGLRVVAIDNIQDVPERRGSKGVKQVGNWIRDLWDTGSFLVLMLGTPAAKEVIWANEQLARRSPTRIEIPYFSVRDDRSVARWKRFLAQVDESLPLAELCGLPVHARALHTACYGIPAYLFALLGEAIGLVVEDGRESITIDDLGAAFAVVMRDAGTSCNPFREGGPARPLDEQGEPFYPWRRAASDSSTSMAAESGVRRPSGSGSD